MWPSDQQIELSDQESCTILLVGSGILSVNRSVYNELILWEILSDDHVDDSHPERICCANTPFHKKTQVEASFWSKSTKVGVSCAVVCLKKGGQRWKTVTGLCVQTNGVQLCSSDQELDKMWTSINVCFFIADELRLFPYFFVKENLDIFGSGATYWCQF